MQTANWAPFERLIDLVVGVERVADFLSDNSRVSANLLERSVFFRSDPSEIGRRMIIIGEWAGGQCKCASVHRSCSFLHTKPLPDTPQELYGHDFLYPLFTCHSSNPQYCLSTIHIFHHMEPASAGIVFIGFAASLATLAGLVLQSSRIIYEICQNVKNTPQDIQDLQDQLQILHGLLQGLEENPPAPTTSEILLETWQFTIQQLQNDMDSFYKRIQRISKTIKKQGIRMPSVGAAFRTFYEADVLRQ